MAESAEGKKEPAQVRVRATSLGNYGLERRKTGAVFFISGKLHESGPKKGKLVEFSDVWMELAPEDKPVAAEKTPHKKAEREVASAGGSREVI